MTTEHLADGRGTSGALQLLFDKHPVVRDELVSFIKRRESTNTAPVSVITPKKIHERFLVLCRQAGVERHEWPFVAMRAGYNAVLDWYQVLRLEDPVRTAANELGDDAAKLVRLDTATARYSHNKRVALAYENCEFDEYHVDGLFTCALPRGAHGVRSFTTSRVWLLAMLETRSKAVLAQTISYRDRYDQRDVNRLLVRAIEPPRRMALTLQNQDFRYAINAAYPAELPGLERNVWRTLSSDADATHCSTAMLAAGESILKYTAIGEPPGEPTRRSYIEGWFSWVAEHMTSLPSATGNHPKSAARRNPEQMAQRYQIAAPAAEQLFDVLCRNYNATPSAACEGLSPLAYLQMLLSRGEVFRSQVGELHESNLWMLLPMYMAVATARRGSYGTAGINKFGGRYVGPALAADREFAACTNKAVRLFVQEDARYAFAVPEALPHKHYAVRLTGRFSDEPHTLDWRRHAYNFYKSSSIQGRALMPNPMHGFLRLCHDVSQKNSAAASFVNDVAAFINRYEGGDTQFISMDPKLRGELDAFMSGQQKDADDEEDDIGSGVQAADVGSPDDDLTSDWVPPVIDPFKK